MYKVNFNSPLPIILKPTDIPLFLKLQAKVCKRLPETEKHFLKPRTEKDLKAHMAAPMPVIGIKQGGMLAAQALLTFPKHSSRLPDRLRLDDWLSRRPKRNFPGKSCP